MRWQHSVFVCLMMLVSFTVAAGEDAADISVIDPWVREAPPGMTVMAGYMVLRNNTSKLEVLVAVNSSSFRTSMIHRSIKQDNMVGMVHESHIELAPNTNLVFAPGGYHLMLMNPKRTLRAGEQVDITLEFRSGLHLPVTFAIRKAI